ncbi:MAG: Transaldolase [Candidatus Dependentiae bacterium ADurb.Bin331]|nr:MAG: Transaldolase [Candidatus Dependentiae bacterium ADurb.Bin331]
MKIFLDTADKLAIAQWAVTGLIDGVTTNPTHLAKEKKSPKELVQEICTLLPQGEISVEVTEKEPDKVYAQALKIAALHQNILVKIPCHKDYYGVIEKLVNDGIKINVTLVFTVVQALFMCKLGVVYISPFVGRWDDIDAHGGDVLFEIREMIDQYNFDTQLLAASLRSVQHVHQAILAGADAATLPIAVLEQCAAHVLTDRGIAQFDADWQKLDIKQFP